MKNDNKEFLEFLTEREAPPEILKNEMQKEIILSFQSRSIIGRFLGFQLLGALVSLSFCPQFGLSFFSDGHGITHHLRMIGDWACALFCGSLFLSSGVLLALVSMEARELWWLWRRKKFFLSVIPAVLWGALMLFNISLKLPSEDISYHLTWIVAAILGQMLCLKIFLVFKNLKVDKF